MQISAISAVSQGAPSYLPSARPSAKPSSSAAPAAAASAPATLPPATSSSTAIQAASNGPANVLSEIYTTRVAGKSYAGDVTYASGVYSISVASLPGSEVSASSLSVAENELNARIDLLV